MGNLHGKVAVITAGTSGMALATAKLFVNEGAYVFVTGRRQQTIDEAVAAIGRSVMGVQGDASNLDDLDRLYEIVKAKKGKIHELFASAGRGEFATISEVTEEHFDTTFGLNVRGTLFTVQKALPLFSDGGSIILNGSITGVKGFPSFSVYAASKAAVRSFARSWLVDLKERRIRVNVLSPGPIDTPGLNQLGPDARNITQPLSLAVSSDDQKKSRPQHCFWHPAIQASSTELSYSSTEEPPRYKRLAVPSSH